MTGTVIAAVAGVVDAIITVPAHNVCHPMILAADVISRIIRTVPRLRDGRHRHRCYRGERQ